MTGNATQSYKRSYDAEGMSDHAVEVEASRLLRHPEIALRFAAFRQTAVADTMLTLEAHMAALRALRDTAKANGQISAAIKAAWLRSRLCGFYTDDKIEHGATVEFDHMTNEQLRKRKFIVEGTRVPKTNAKNH